MTLLFKRFSSRENLKLAYQYVQYELAHSSLSVNPINHPSITAINDLGEHFFIALEQYIRDGMYKPEQGFFVYIPKDNLGLRPLCMFSMIDRIIYQAIFNQNILGFKIDGQLSDRVCFSNRINENEKDEDFLNPYFNDWDDFCEQQKNVFEKGYKWKIEVDVQQYYEHILIKKLIEKLKDEFDIKDKQIMEILKKQLHAWTEYKELPKGIPQGPRASAVLGNVYLSSLDKYAEEELIGKDLQYFRYADDMTIMGTSKDVVLKAIEKIVRFLREQNLTLNEKTSIIKLDDTQPIEEMRFYSYYDNNAVEIPENDFERIQANVPHTLSLIENEEKVEKKDIRELKYFLKVDTSYDFLFTLKLIEIIPLQPSLTVPIIQYVTESTAHIDVDSIDDTLWNTFTSGNLSEWSRFWIWKLLLSHKDVFANIDEEVKKILSSKNNTIFKIVCFYYQAIQEREIDIDQVKQAVDGSKTDVEKSLYSFFFLNAFQNIRAPTVKNLIEKLLDSTSHELNLIGSYLFKNKPKAIIDNFSGNFSNYLLKKHTKKKSNLDKKEIKLQDCYLVRSENLIPVSSPPTIFGIKRIQKKKQVIKLEFPEIVQWDKVTIKIKEGLRDIEILYNNSHIKNASYIDLGLYIGEIQQKTNREWQFLILLSALIATDKTRATTQDMAASLTKQCKKKIISADNIHSIKRKLDRSLQNIFQKNDNESAFYDYQDKGHYEPKFTLLSTPELRREQVWSSTANYDDTVAYNRKRKSTRNNNKNY